MSDFSEFWSLYPRRVAKKDAFRAWGKLTIEQQQKAISACHDWKRIWGATEMQFIPHPATWLNGWRFDDELPIETKVSAAAHVAAILPNQNDPRGTMPDAFRSVVARLRRA